MKILINDHAGHPFQVQLSRALAGRGHRVLHMYCASVLQPRGRLGPAPGDPEGFRIQPIELSREFNRYGLISRWRQEKQLGSALARTAGRFRPDVVCSANTPLRAQAALMEASRRIGARFVFWVQDVLGVGIRKALRKRLPLVGSPLGAFFEYYERSLWAGSDAIVLITEDFLPRMPARVRSNGHVRVIENWAPLEEMPRLPKAGDWSRAHGLDDKLCLVYSGTLGMKHNPELLSNLALHFKGREEVRVVVVTEGLGAEFLRKEKERKALHNLVILDFQPYEALPAVLAAADVLLAILEPDAGVFAVPSKVLTYLCAHRPLLLAVPPENLAARIVTRAGAGIVVPPSDEWAYIAAAERLLDDPGLRESMAAAGLAYARETFDIEKIADAFEEIFCTGACRPGAVTEESE